MYRSGCICRFIFLLQLLFGTVAIAGDSPTPAPTPSTTLPPPLAQAERELRLLPGGQAPLRLSHEFVVASSLELEVDGEIWQPNRDYRLRARSGFIIPLRSWVAYDSAPGQVSTVVVRYSYIPVLLPSRRDLWEISANPAASRRSLSLPDSKSEPFAEETNVGELDVRGSKTIEVSSGTQREMTVNQNLRLSITGQLTRDIAVRAFLSDDNLPVVPEGNTEQLRDIDKVMVALEAPSWQATLGDFVASHEGSVFGNYRRKLQGFSLSGQPQKTEFEVLGGSPRGLYRTLQIRGQEAQQGPYYLGGNGANGQLFVVAGSERVTLDGVALTRGADRDYTIDYIVGTVTFTYRQLITAESVIVVEYEEGEGPFGRTVVGAGAGLAFELPWLGTTGHMHARMIREKDDPGRLRTGSLGPDDESVLAGAGDDANLAVAGGVTSVPAGSGHYDEGQDGTKTIYIFNEAAADFDVVFFRVESGLGDYDLDRLTASGITVYRHVGDGQGHYRIGRPLAMPERLSVATFRGDFGDTTQAFLVGEWNVSQQDLNVLSDRDDADNAGGAGHLVAGLRATDIGLAGLALGDFGLRGSWTRKGGQFHPFEVYKTVFDYTRWGLDERARAPGFLDEEESEAAYTASWKAGANGKNFDLDVQYARLEHGQTLTADRSSGRLAWELAGGQGRHSLERSQASDPGQDLAIARISSRHRMSWSLGQVTPSLRFNSRRWQDEAAATGQRAAGFQYEEYGAGLRWRPGSWGSWQADFVNGLSDSLRVGVWDRERESQTTHVGVTSGRFAGMRLVGEGTLRRLKRPSGQDETTRLARSNLAGDWDRLGSDWSLGYRVDNSRSVVLDRQITFVGQGQGDFDSDGRYLGDGQGDHNMVLVSTDSLVATTGVVANLNWKQSFRLLGADHWYGAWTAQTLTAIESRSTTGDMGGLLKLDPAVVFDRDTAVFADLNFSEEFVFLQHLRTADLRAKFTHRETVDRRFVDHPEDRLKNTWQVTGNLNITRHQAMKLRLQREDDNRFSTENSVSSRRSVVARSQRLELGWSYRPSTLVRLGFQGEYINRRDAVSEIRQRELAVRPTWRSRFSGDWTLQGDLRFADVRSDEAEGVLRPFFFARPGLNVDTVVRLAWEPSRLLTVSASWVSRKSGGGRWQHDLRLETTARF